MYFTEQDYIKIQQWLLAHAKKDSEFEKAELPLKGEDCVAIVLTGRNVTTELSNLVDGLPNVTKFAFIIPEEYQNISPRQDTFYFCVLDGEIVEAYIGGKSVFSYLQTLITNIKEDLVSIIGDDLAVYLENLLTVDRIKVSPDINLKLLLDILDSSTSTTDEVTPYLLIYNPISNTFVGTTSVKVEFGTRIINKANILRARFVKGSSGGLGVELRFRINQGSNNEYVIINSSLATNNPVGYTFESVTPENSYYADLYTPLVLSLDSAETEDTSRDISSIFTFEGINTVTRKTVNNVVAKNLITADGKPTKIGSDDVKETKENYLSRVLSCNITYNSFQYMYILRSENPFTLASFGGTLGKTGYIARLESLRGNWTIGNTTGINLYYAILVPAGMSVTKFFTTFLGNDSTVDYDLIGTVSLQGATSQVSALYRVYASKLKVAFGEGTMTFTIN